MARTPLNEHCSAAILNKLPEKLGDPSKFLIPFLHIQDVTPTRITLELADCLISQPIGIAEDVFVKVGVFHFPADFVVVDFDADPRFPLILGRSFLKTGRALIDVYEGELTLRVGKEAITFNLDQTSRYSSNYDDMNGEPNLTSLIRAFEEYSQEDFRFFSDVNARSRRFSLHLKIAPNVHRKVDHSYYDSEGDILLLKAFLNDDPSLPSPTKKMYLPKIQKELKVCEAKNDKYSIDEPPEVELKDLPPHLECAFLEGKDKLPVIIAKDLSVEEKAALIKEKSHFMVKEGIVLGHKISKNRIEVDKAKVDVIAKLPHPTTV
ncbi:reverse transcriptase domain-containing protein, partial [Tanacetum coccineum]